MSIDPTGFSLSTIERDGRVVLALRGELDLATAPELEQTITERLAADKHVVVDLRELEFMDSSGLRILVAAHARAAGGAARFAVVRPPADGPVARILAIAGVDGELEMVDEA
jgi:anti-anti-sigma factor